MYRQAKHCSSQSRISDESLHPTALSSRERLEAFFRAQVRRCVRTRRGGSIYVNGPRTRVPVQQRRSGRGVGDVLQKSTNSGNQCSGPGADGRRADRIAGLGDALQKSSNSGNAPRSCAPRADALSSTGGTASPDTPVARATSTWRSPSRRTASRASASPAQPGDGLPRASDGARTQSRRDSGRFFRSLRREGPTPGAGDPRSCHGRPRRRSLVARILPARPSSVGHPLGDDLPMTGGVHGQEREGAGGSGGGRGRPRPPKLVHLEAVFSATTGGASGAVGGLPGRPVPEPDPFPEHDSGAAEAPPRRPNDELPPPSGLRRGQEPRQSLLPQRTSTDSAPNSPKRWR
jgi:hypothetical protein